MVTYLSILLVLAITFNNVAYVRQQKRSVEQ